MYDNNMIMSLQQKKRKFKPRIKLSHNNYKLDKIIDALVKFAVFRKGTVSEKPLHSHASLHIKEMDNR